MVTRHPVTISQISLGSISLFETRYLPQELGFMVQKRFERPFCPLWTAEKLMGHCDCMCVFGDIAAWYGSFGLADSVAA